MIARISILTIALTIQTAYAQTAPAAKPDLAKAKQTAETVCAACPRRRRQQHRGYVPQAGRPARSLHSQAIGRIQEHRW